MNRLLLTAATALTMAATGVASAATGTLDSFAGGNAVGDDFIYLAGNGASFSHSLASYSSSGFTFSRELTFTQSESDAQASLLLGDTYLGTPLGGDQYSPVGAWIMNPSVTNSALSLSYGIGALDAAVGNGSVRFDVQLLNATAGDDHPLLVDVILDNQTTPLTTWTVTTPLVLGDQPPLSHSWTFSGAALSGASQLSFVVRADPGFGGYNAVISPLTFDVLPVPEAGLLPMFGSGLLVMGFAARRKLRAKSR